MMERATHYVLIGKEPVPCDLTTWAKWFNKNDRLLCHSWHYGILTSTVFLGIDHNFFPGGPPVLFETMIFGGKHNDYQKRYTSYDDAIAGHWEAFTKVVASAHMWDGAIYRIAVWRQRKRLFNKARILVEKESRWKKKSRIVINAFIAAAYRAINILHATISKRTRGGRSMG